MLLTDIFQESAINKDFYSEGKFSICIEKTIENVYIVFKIDIPSIPLFYDYIIDKPISIFYDLGLWEE